MRDLIDRLRDTPCNREPFTPAHADCQCRTANEAADEIERLRNALRIMTEANRLDREQAARVVK